MPQLTSVNTLPERSIPLRNADSGVSIGDVFRTLRSRRILIFGITLACILCAVVYLLIKKPLYEGSAIVRIDPGRTGSLGLNDLSNVGVVDVDSAINTEIAVIKSDGVTLRMLRSLPDATFQSFTGVSKATAALPDHLEVLSPDQQDILEDSELNTDAKQVIGTALIDVTVRATDPKTAADVVNNLVKAYTIQNFTSRDNSVAELRTWLSAQMANLKDQVDTAQKKLADFQESHNILGTEGTSNTTTDRLKILNQSLATAQADTIEKESRLRAASSAYPSALATLFPNPDLTALQAAQGELYTKSAQLSAKFGPKYPPLIEINKQLASLDSEIANNVNTVRQRLQQEYNAAKNNEDALRKQYDAQTQTAYGVNRNQAEGAVLQGDVTSNTELYDILRRKMQQASVDADVNGVNTVLVDSSRIPVRPAAPKKLLILAGSLILGLFAGIVAAFISEASSDTLRSPLQIEKELGVPVLGILPRGGNGASLVTLAQPASENAEAYRLLRNSVLYSMPGEHSKKLLVASALPGEGAAKVAANLAVSLAQAGHRVLAVDSDLRAPSLHQEFGVENVAGLSNSLVNSTAVMKLSQPVKSLGNLSLITAGPAVDFPSERLAAETFHAMLKGWESSYDYVVLQSAPLLVVSDGLSLASWSDAVLLVTRFGVTHVRSLAEVKNMLDRNGAHVAGALIDDVPKADMEGKAYGRVANAYFA